MELEGVTSLAETTMPGFGILISNFERSTRHPIGLVNSNFLLTTITITILLPFENREEATQISEFCYSDILDDGPLGNDCQAKEYG